MKNESLIHLKFDYTEAVESKKDLLYVEKALMITATKMKEYLSSRLEELEKRLKLHRKAKELTMCIKKIQKNIPKVEFKKEKVEEEIQAKKTIKTKKVEHESDIEFQLQEIQKKLDALQ